MTTRKATIKLRVDHAEETPPTRDPNKKRRIRAKGRRIAPEVKLAISKMLAEFKPKSSILMVINGKYNANINGQYINRIKKANASLIAQMRAKYVDAYMDVAIANKRVRLERRDELYTSSEEIKDPSQRVTARLRCLADARTEVEGPGVAIGNTYNTQINQYSDMGDIEIKEHIKKLKNEVITMVKQREGEYAV